MLKPIPVSNAEASALLKALLTRRLSASVQSSSTTYAYTQAFPSSKILPTFSFGRWQMRAALPGTKHTTALDRREPTILEDMQHAKGVRKFETMRCEWTGPTRQLRLELQPTPWATVEPVIEGWLFLGSGKRQVIICPEPKLPLHALRQQLASALHRHGVEVHVRGEKRMAEHTMAVKECWVMTPDKAWPYCEAVYRGVQQVRDLEERELELQLQLDDLRVQKQALQAQTLEALAQVLKTGQLAA